MSQEKERFKQLRNIAEDLERYSHYLRYAVAVAVRGKETPERAACYEFLRERFEDVRKSVNNFGEVLGDCDPMPDGRAIRRHLLEIIEIAEDGAKTLQGIKEKAAVLMRYADDVTAPDFTEALKEIREKTSDVTDAGTLIASQAEAVLNSCGA